MLNLSGLKHIALFFAPPVNRDPREPKREKWTRKNDAYLEELRELAERKPEVQKEFFEELESLDRCFPEAPEESLAHLFICKAAAELAGPWDIPRLVEMLFWEQVIDAPNVPCVKALLKAIDKKGYEEDVALLNELFLELGKPHRYYHREDNGNLIPLPGIVELREEVKRTVSNCRVRGSRDTEARREISNRLLWRSAGY